MTDRYLSRKLIVAVLGMLLACFLRWRGLIADGAWESVMLAALLGYPAANVAQKALEGKQP
jgi:hypothetical protein